MIQPPYETLPVASDVAVPEFPAPEQPAASEPPADSVAWGVADPAVPESSADLVAPLPADSLLTGCFEPPLTAADSLVLACQRTPEELFGTHSVRILPVAEPVATPAMEEQPLFQGMALALLFAYLYIFCRSIFEIRALFGRFDPASRTAGELHSDSQGSAYRSFRRLMLCIGLPLVGLLALRLGGDNLPIAITPSLVALLACAAALAVALFEGGALRLWGYLALAEPITHPLLSAKMNYFALGTLVMAPCALLLLLEPLETGRWILWLLAAGGIILTFLYLKESLKIFVEKKISILHWILYLCTVEIFPISLLFFWLSRN